jgi:hypothetical protein
MTALDRDEEVTRLRTRLSRIGIIQTPFLLLVVFGTCAKVLGAEQPFGPLLDDPKVTTGMLVVGGTIMVWTWGVAIPIFRRIARLERGLRP